MENYADIEIDRKQQNMNMNEDLPNKDHQPVPVVTTVTSQQPASNQQQQQQPTQPQQPQQPQLRQPPTTTSPSQQSNSGLVNRQYTTFPSERSATERSWTYELFDCFTDLNVTLRTCLMPCIVVEEVSTQYGELPSQMCFWQACGCNFIPHLRNEMRRAHNITGDTVNDHLLGNMCMLCTLVQMKREMDLARFNSAVTPINSRPPADFMQMQRI